MPKEAEITGKKALSLCLLRVLEKYATPAQPLTTRALMEFMRQDYGLDFERKAVGRNLTLLTEMGFPLSTYQENGKGYYLTDEASKSHFAQDADARLILTDALLRAPRFCRSDTLLEAYQEEVPILAIQEMQAKQAESLLANIFILRRAIAAGVQIRFKSSSIYMEEETEMPATQASPYAVAFVEGQYYVLLSMAGYGKLLHQRCDQMRHIEMTEAAVRPLTELSGRESSLQEYILQNVYRAGAEESYVLLCKRHLRDEALSVFGTAMQYKAEGEYLRVTVQATWPKIYQFLLRHLKFASLLSPTEAAARFAEELRQAAACYPG